MIPDTVIQEVKERIDASSIFSRHLRLRKSGAGFIGSCPFHEDRTPSFRVYPEQARFHCYGCGAHGDVFAFLQRLSGRPFPAVVRDLASEVGIAVADDAPDDPARRDRADVVAACAAAQERFEACLWSPVGEVARTYLRARGVSETTARDMRLGFAAGDLALWAAAAGSQRGLLLAGLLAEREGTVRDRFEGRVTIPLCGHDGRVLGFAARSSRPGMVPPFLTTPENAAFKHSRVLFGLSQAAGAVRSTRRALFVAGYFDVMACREAQVPNAVGGSPIAVRHVAMLRQHGAGDIVVLVPAGGGPFEASPEFAAAVFTSTVTLWIAHLPSSNEGHTSAEAFVRAHGRAGVEALVSAAVPLSEHLIERALAAEPQGVGRRSDVEGKVAAVAWLARYAAAMPHGLERNLFERRIAQRLHLTLRAVRGASREAAAAPGASGIPMRRRGSRRRRRW